MTLRSWPGPEATFDGQFKFIFAPGHIGVIVPAMHRLRMVAPTRWLAARETQLWKSRPLTPADSEVTSKLLVSAYLGTGEATDEDHEEVGLFFAGEWGPPIPEATVAISDRNGVMVAASLVCEYEGDPLLAHVVSAPAVRGLGAGVAAIAGSAKGLSGIGVEQIHLAVSAHNLSALRLYAHLGFALYADDAVASESGLRYESEIAFEQVREQIERSLPGPGLPSCYGLGVRRDDGTIHFDYLNTGPEHQLPGRILALMAGHRSGVADIDLDYRTVDALVELWTPAGAATIYDHPNLESWRRVRDAGDAATTFVARFCNSS
jgi:hypothetical protein